VLPEKGRTLKHLRRRYLLVVIVITAVCAAVFIAWRLYSPPALYRITILPSLGGSCTQAYSLNDRGQIIGVERMGEGAERLFLWDRRSGMQDLGPTTGNPLIINNAGQISGTMVVDTNSCQAFLWEPGKGRTMLGTLGGRESYVYAMNNRGQITGLSRTAIDSINPFLWDRERGMRQLTAPDGRPCEPVNTNNAGQILVMGLEESPMPPSLWFLLDPNGLRPLDGVPPNTWLRSINAHSCMAGIEMSSGPLPCLLLRDEQGRWRRLFPMNSPGETTRLNDRKQIAYSESAHGRWEEMRDRLHDQFFGRHLPSFETMSYL
jgi:probable HAF family extracellular repeat protein